MEMRVYSVQRQIEKGNKLAEKINAIRIQLYDRLTETTDPKKVKAALEDLNLTEDDLNDLYRYLSGSAESLQKELENKNVDIVCW